MPVQTLDSTRTATPAISPVTRRFVRLSAGAAIYSYLLVVFGGIVRITGSGLGCGDDWPLCNGHILPPWDLPTWIEWTHRLLAAGLVVPIAMVTVLALRNRAAPGMGGPGGATRPALLAVMLLAVQIILGAVTVKLDLPAGVTSLHFVNALLMIAALVVAAVRAQATVSPLPASAEAPRFRRGATAAAVIGFFLVVFGALTANTGLHGATTAPSAAALACQGFPLCNGQWMPDGAMLVHIHWTHRIIAYLLFFHVIGATIAAFRRGAPAPVARAAAVTAALVVAQVLVAAGMVEMHLPSSFRVLHLVIGAALWMALVVWATRTRGMRASTS